MPTYDLSEVLDGTGLPRNKGDMMRKLAALSIAMAVVVGLPTPQSTSLGHEGLPGMADPGIVFQSPEEAVAHDLALIAESQDWTLGQVEQYYQSEQAIGSLAVEIAARWPDRFVGTVLSRDPTGKPTLYLKGSPEPALMQMVAAADVDIVVVDGQPYSRSELDERKSRVHTRLREAGYASVVTTWDIGTGGLITTMVTAVDGLERSPGRIAELLPSDLRSDVNVVVTDAPTVIPEGAFGGMSMLDAGDPLCTSGWTVQQLGSGTRGVSTAAHCFNVDQINHPGHGVHAATSQGSHVGQWGEAAWYTTIWAEVDDFYADAATIRDVGAVEPVAGIAQNEFVCGYGRGTNDRDCSLRVLNPSMDCGAFDRMVQMEGDTLAIGDSGGGWSKDFKAYGGHYGNCAPAKDSFSVADLFDEALGVFVPQV